MPKNQIGNRIKELRNELKLSQEAFANRIRKGKSTVANIEIGINELSPSMRLAICNEFDVREEWVLTGEGKKFNEGEVREKAAPDYATNQGVKVSDDLTMAARILESGTPYAVALHLNISSFHQALQNENRLVTVEKRLDDMSTEIFSLKTANTALKREVDDLRTASAGDRFQDEPGSPDTEKKVM